MFKTINDVKNACLEALEPNHAFIEAAKNRQAILTKPAGSLGKMEQIACWLAGWQGREKPQLNKVDTLIFAGNHGVTAQGVSCFPAEVTHQMVLNFKHGGAAINQLCKLNGSTLKVFDIELERPTHDFSVEAAMDETDFLAAINIGANAVSPDMDMICLGEMGIGNTTSASAICLALFGGDATQWTGKGTGLDDDAVKQKAAIIEKSVNLHADFNDQPLEILRRLGGRELAAILGATLSARHKNIPVLLDGFICSAAIAPLYKLNKNALNIAIAGHLSLEAGHIKLLKAIEKQPLLHMDMRLGEGSGAAVALNIVRAAIATHNGMATFAEAGVADKT